MRHMSSYPIVLTDLDSGGGVIVIGGGQVAARKVEGLLAAGANVTVISPQLAPPLEALAQQSLIQVLRRPFQPGDLAKAQLVIAATDDPHVNETVWQEARECGCLVNVVDDPARCTFHVPALVRRGPVIVATGTGGASPALSKHLRKKIETLVGPEYGQLAELLESLRPQVRRHVPAEKREALWSELIDRLLPLLQAGQIDQARQTAQTIFADLCSSV